MLALGLRLADVNRVFIARFKAGLIAVAVPDVRHRMFLLRNTRHHLFIQSFAQRLLRFQYRVGKGVFRLQIVQHLRVCALVVAQPIIVIYPRVAVGSNGIRSFFCLRGCHHC
ncbi:hypothetical protein D3C73_1483600 [compost metagenome]